MGYLELAIFAFVVVGWIIRTIYKFVKWSINQVKTVGVAPSPIQQAIAEAQRQQATAAVPPSRPPAPRPQMPRLQTASRPIPMPRRPDAGSPLVAREATRAEFDRAERDLMTTEPSPLDTPLRSTPRAPESAPFALFENTDDLVRAVILQEVLSPPLSRRRSR